MTVQSITAVLNELDSQFDGKYDNTGYPWLEFDEVASIILANNESIYPDKTEQVKFNHSLQTMYLRKGFYNEDGVFIENYVSGGIDYSLVVGIIMVQPEHKKSPYKFGSQV
jgi:hypothetical protein